MIKMINFTIYSFSLGIFIFSMESLGADSFTVRSETKCPKGYFRNAKVGARGVTRGICHKIGAEASFRVHIDQGCPKGYFRNAKVGARGVTRGICHKIGAEASFRVHIDQGCPKDYFRNSVISKASGVCHKVSDGHSFVVGQKKSCPKNYIRTIQNLNRNAECLPTPQLSDSQVPIDVSDESEANK